MLARYGSNVKSEWLRIRTLHRPAPPEVSFQASSGPSSAHSGSAIVPSGIVILLFACGASTQVLSTHLRESRDCLTTSVRKDLLPEIAAFGNRSSNPAECDAAVTRRPAHGTESAPNRTDRRRSRIAAPSGHAYSGRSDQTSSPPWSQAGQCSRLSSRKGFLTALPTLCVRSADHSARSAGGRCSTWPSATRRVRSRS